MLGIALSIFFTIWALSGIVLIFDKFPHFSTEESFAYQAPIDSISANSAIFPSELPEGELSLEMEQGQALYRVGKLARTAQSYNAATLAPVVKPSKETCIAAARRVVSDDTIKVVKINKLDIWLPWAQYKSSLPIYKVYFKDDARSVVYVSAKSGTVLQHTTKSNRLLAILGPIPHYVIFKYLSLYYPFANSLLVMLLVLGGIVAILGLAVGIARYIKAPKGSATPYKAFWFRWHHLLGLAGGLFMLTFLFSAYFSIDRDPKMSGKGHKEHKVHRERDYQKEWAITHFSRDAFKASFPTLQKLLVQRKDIRRVAFGSALGTPCYYLYAGNPNDAELLLAKGDSLVPVKGFTTRHIETFTQKIADVKIASVELLTRYDSYYQKTRMGKRALPVVKLVLEDKRQSWLYVSVQSGELLSVYDKDRRIDRWLYRALHTLNFQWMKEHEWLRKTTLVLLCIAIAMVSISSIVLTARRINRKMNRRRGC